MEEHIRKWGAPREGGATSLGELIHAAVRQAIEVAVHEELLATLGADTYERTRNVGATATAPSRGR